MGDQEEILKQNKVVSLSLEKEQKEEEKDKEQENTPPQHD